MSPARPLGDLEEVHLVLVERLLRCQYTWIVCDHARQVRAQGRRQPRPLGNAVQKLQFGAVEVGNDRRLGP